ncbi:MAG: hypothetical protein NTX64_05290 [Elusimicrobia bacterium]|nr:hypothetical protein [Elusimicrobiota bacterium]
MKDIFRAAGFAFVSLALCALPASSDDTKSKSGKAFQDLKAAEEGKLDEEPDLSLQLPAKPKPAPKKETVREQPKVKPQEAEPVEVKPQEVKPQEVRKRTVLPPDDRPGGSPVTVYWHVTEDADVYLNGRPLRDYSPDFKTRGNEGRKDAFSAKATLHDDDLFTVGARRGDNWGFMLVALDSSGKVVFATDKDAWKTYAPEGSEDWFLPAVVERAVSKPISIQPDLRSTQKSLSRKHGGKALSIWADPGEKFAYLYGRVSLLGAESDRSR